MPPADCLTKCRDGSVIRFVAAADNPFSPAKGPIRDVAFRLDRKSESVGKKRWDGPIKQ